MESQQQDDHYFFVDESGDPTFYDAKGHLIVGEKGCSPILILGFISTAQPQILRRELSRLQQELATDKYLAAVPSLKKSLRAFHAKDDCPEIRQAVFKLIVNLPFESQFIVARKIEKVFTTSFNRNENKFYDNLASRLFENVLYEHKFNHIYFDQRGSRKRQKLLEAAIHSGLERFEERWDTKIISNIFVQSQIPSAEPCLQITDYMNWALQRVFTIGEMRYFDFVKEKVKLVWDVYDLAKYPNNYYHSGNPLDTKKISPL
ncbi:DUF3800 domain-containing protein [candidate division KSB1 bacterium]|nr:DUF3800 domain-containing protein [candidate division KSB1 bacterium]